MWFCKHRRADEICHVRRAAAGKFNNIITMNYSKYVHATRKKAAHLTRCAYAHPSEVH